MARNLVVIGLALIAAGILVHLLAVAIQIAIPAGLLLMAIGIVWHVVESAKRGR